MRNTTDENLAEHSAETAFIAHALALIGNKFYGKDYDADKIAVFALYHDASEIITGDLPTPIKYYSEEMRKNYKMIEASAEKMLLSRLSEDFRDIYADIFSGANEQEHKIVKAADKLCALIKCIEEAKGGNAEFANAEASTRKALENMDCPEAEYFMKEFLPAFSDTLDEISF